MATQPAIVNEQRPTVSAMAPQATQVMVHRPAVAVKAPPRKAGIAQRPPGAPPTGIFINETPALPARSVDKWILVDETAASSAVAERCKTIYRLSSFTNWHSYSGCYHQHSAALTYFRLTLDNTDKPFLSNTLELPSDGHPVELPTVQLKRGVAFRLNENRRSIGGGRKWSRSWIMRR
jgi:hypothetical protein